MKKLLLVLLSIGFSYTADAAMTCSAAGTYCSNVVITSYLVRDNGQIILSVDGDVPNTCSYAGYTLRIETNNGTEADNPMFSSLLTFIAQHKKVHLGITPTEVSLRGTDHTNGCTTSSPALVRTVRVYYNAAEYGPDQVISGDEPL